MPTTPLSSDQPVGYISATVAVMGRWWLSILTLTLLSGCVSSTKPSDFFALTPEILTHRTMQTRFFETANEHELLSASAALLQDLGFQIDESQREVGFLRAVKERSAREYGQEIGRTVWFFLSFGKVRQPVDLHHKIVAALVSRPLNPDATHHEIRIAFYRVVWKGDGQVDYDYIPPGAQYMEMVNDPVVYQQFFAKLSKSVFLEAHRI